MLYEVITGFGIVKIDPIKEEVRETYYPSNGLSPILDVAFRNDSIFAITESTLYTGNLTNPALVDPAEWSIDVRAPVQSVDTYAGIENVFGELFLSLKVDGYGMDTVYHINASGLDIPFIPSFPAEIMDVRNVNGNLMLVYFEGFV